LEIDGGPGDDYDGDGFLNGFEFLFQMDATQIDQQSPGDLNIVNGGAQFTLSLDGNALEDGILPYVEDSVDLINWYPAGENGSILSLQSDTSALGLDGIQNWQFAPLEEKGFVRFGTIIQEP